MTETGKNYTECDNPGPDGQALYVSSHADPTFNSSSYYYSFLRISYLCTKYDQSTLCFPPPTSPVSLLSMTASELHILYYKITY